MYLIKILSSSNFISRDLWWWRFRLKKFKQCEKQNHENCGIWESPDQVPVDCHSGQVRISIGGSGGSRKNYEVFADVFCERRAVQSSELVFFKKKYFEKKINLVTLAQALKMPIETQEIIVSDTIDRSLRDPFSTIVTLPERDGEVAGCLLNSVWRRADPPEGANFSSGDFPDNFQLFGGKITENLKKKCFGFLVGFLNSIHSNFWNLAPKNVDAVIHR